MARTATSNTPPAHYIVDGSNIATEGRAMPSLKQLNEAVLAFIEEHPSALVTVVVDATFGHRIDKKEVKAFDEAVANNELVTPPAGAVGRGDAFVLSIANKAKAGILSNDSFQEFHGDYPWLFDEGRLIGGKPVPHVGWVFVERLPVRGPKSRQSVKDARQGTKEAGGRPRGRGSGSPLADQPLPVPTSPPPGLAQTAKVKRAVDEVSIAKAAAAVPSGGKTPVNDLLPFLDFVERHPVGTGCTVVVESYASHGAYGRAGDVLVYLPLRLMGDPMPRSARAAVKIGEAVAVAIVGYVPERRSIDAALVSAGEAAARPTVAEPEPLPAAPRRRAKAQVKEPLPEIEAAPAAEVPPAEAGLEPARKRRTKKATKAAEPAAEPVVDEAPVKRARKVAPAAKSVAKQAPAKKAPAKKAPAKKAPAKKAPAKKAPPKKAAAKKADAG
jgi:hypothetical protein